MSRYIYIDIDSPTDRIVYQRDANNHASIPVSGRFKGDVDVTSVTARLFPIHPDWGTPCKDVTLAFDALAGTFHGKLDAAGGWYRLEITVAGEAGEWASAGATVDHVGVGEVFVTFGHSCAQGGMKEDPGAQDDRVSCVNLRHSFLHESQYPFAFEHLSHGSQLGPWNATPHAWGILADSIVKRLNVPVLMMGAAFGGTNIEMNYKVSQQIPYEHSFSNYSRGMPYRPFLFALQRYASRTGIRSALVQHGGNDVGSSDRAKFTKEFGTLIEHTRKVTGMPHLGFMLMKEGEFKGQWAGPGEENINGGIADLVKNVPQVFQGPYYGDIPGEAPFKPDAVHLGPLGLPLYAEIWEKAILDSDFIARCKPTLATLV